MYDLPLIDIIKKYYDEIIPNCDFYLKTETILKEPLEEYKIFYEVTSKKDLKLYFLNVFFLLKTEKQSNYSYINFRFIKKIDEDIKLDAVQLCVVHNMVETVYNFDLTANDLTENYEELKTSLILSDDTGKLRERYEINN